MKHKEDYKAWTENDHAANEKEGNKETQADFVNEQDNVLSDAENVESDPLIKMEVELAEQKDKLLRLYSEFENYKKRVSREKTEQLKYAAIDTYLTFLPVIDDFERAQKSMEDATDVNSVREGVKLIYHKFKTLLESKGVKAMNAVGTAFDPDLHDAISNIPAASSEQKGMVIDEIERGYLLNDKVIRHAKVIVAN